MVPVQKGTQAGDPLSPYLFILAADFFQLMVQQASWEGLSSHLCSDLTYPVLRE